MKACAAQLLQRACLAHTMGPRAWHEVKGVAQKDCLRREEVCRARRADAGEAGGARFRGRQRAGRVTSDQQHAHPLGRRRAPVVQLHPACVHVDRPAAIQLPLTGGRC